MKKIVSVLLVSCLVILTPIRVSANVDIIKEEALNSVIESIRSKHQNAEIIVKDGEIHVYLANESNSRNTNLRATENKVCAPEGGIWLNFIRPWYTYFNPDAIIPYAVVYYSHDETELMYEAYTNRSLLEFLLDSNIVGMGVDTFIARIAIKFGLSVDVATALFVISGEFKYAYDCINEFLFFQAVDIKDPSYKIRVDYTTMNGYPVNYYAGWTGNYVTDSPYQDFEPTFHSGVYSP